MPDKNHWEKVYQMPLAQIPWEIEGPPAELLWAIKTGGLKPCKALDVACGTGNYSIFLAKNNFDVTAVDISENALEIARRKAAAQGVVIKFFQADATKLGSNLDGNFDFVLDYSLLHHIAKKDFKKYASQFARLLKPGGKLLLVCYSEKDEAAGGKKSGIGKFGNKIYYRARGEIKEAHAPLREIHYSETTLGKNLHHKGHFFLFQKSG